jgi:hypothetical protein
MTLNKNAFDRSIQEQIRINQARTPTERFLALCDLLDSLRAMAPMDPESVRRREAIQRTRERGIRYAIIGGLAVIQHGRVRSTEDVDALISIPALELPALFEALRARGFEIDLQRNIRELNDDGTTCIRFADVLVDLLRPIVPAYSHVLDRAVTREVLGQKVQIGSIEGLIITKLMGMRSQDEADIQELLTAAEGNLDKEFLRAELASFTSPQDPRRAKLEQWLK